MRVDDALGLIAQAFAEARGRGLKPMAVSVLDTGGHVVAAAREDGAGFARLRLAEAKAWGALGLGLGTRALSERAEAAPAFFAAAASLFDGRLIPVPGGLLLSRRGETLGAIGVSGDAADADEACGLQAAAALGFEAKA